MTAHPWGTEMSYGEDSDKSHQTPYEQALGHRTLPFSTTMANGIQFVIYLAGAAIILGAPIMLGLAFLTEGEIYSAIILLVCSGVLLLGVIFGLLVKVGADSISAGMYLANQEDY